MQLLLRMFFVSFFTPVFLAGCQDVGYGITGDLAGSKTSFTSLPMEISDADFKSLRTLRDVPLEKELATALKSNPKWKRLILQKKMAVGVVDIRDPYNVRYASVNGDAMMYAASLPKIAILLAAMDAIEKGEIEETDEVLTDLNKMISVSSNTCATKCIDLLGYEKIESVLTDPKYELYDEDYGGGLWVGKRYAAQGARHPDPLQGLSHAATVTQVCRFYYLMAFGRLITKERSRQMLLLMDDPALHHKFVNTLDKIAPGVKLYRKSGSWATYHSDSVLVWGSVKRRYILVGLVDDPDGEAIIRAIVRPVERVLKTGTAAG